MTTRRDAREHLAQWRADCRECSGLAMCKTHREARRTLSRQGPDAYRVFARKASEGNLTRMAEDLADSFGTEMAAGLADGGDDE